MLVKDDFKKVFLGDSPCAYGKIDLKTKAVVMITDKRHFYAFKGVNDLGEQLEIDLEPCVGGFCVAIFDDVPNILGDKICVGDHDLAYLFDILGIMPRSDEVWDKALEIANAFAEKYRILDKVSLENLTKDIEKRTGRRLEDLN